ncbi:type II toxin-antitoxin system RelE/ParE family toxin [Variovorax sp. N23]|uniref:type II toxin-antitoxin system RelE/ParE family toxin n=1 Tax=Variovorax sp. N23 TaxID=2980555 RepID=UPI0021C6CADE|nr:type II toxin-antitoxin system RelE/ParE family toxin [Variovorax sp. N23]MCU4122095.1 type II toxin-antitoxin system RelE/ParE family toxin [Variovorax sp. N23]
MKLVWTRLAQEDRRAIREYIAGDNPRAALAMDALVSEKAARLVSLPEMGKPGRVLETRELVIHRSYILIYAIKSDQVQVLRVLHTARRWPPTGKGPSS